MRTNIKALATSLVVIGGIGVAHAQGIAPPKPDQAIHYRQSAMAIQGAHFGAIGAMVRGDRPYDKDVLLHHAQIVETMSRLPFDAMQVPGSDKGQTKMKPEAQQEKDKFLADAKKLQEETTKLVAAAKTGDMGMIKTQFGATGGACKTCHDAYRAQ